MRIDFRDPTSFFCRALSLSFVSMNSGIWFRVLFDWPWPWRVVRGGLFARWRIIREQWTEVTFPPKSRKRNCALYVIHARRKFKGKSRIRARARSVAENREEKSPTEEWSVCRAGCCRSCTQKGGESNKKANICKLLKERKKLLSTSSWLLVPQSKSPALARLVSIFFSSWR